MSQQSPGSCILLPGFLSGCSGRPSRSSRERRAGSPKAEGTLKIICYIPAVMLLMIHNRYDSQLTSFLSLLAALWFSVAYEKMTLRSSAARAAVFLVMLALLYYIAGSASFIFAFLVTIYELFVGRRRVLKMLFPTVAIGTYLVPDTFLPYKLKLSIFNYYWLDLVMTHGSETS